MECGPGIRATHAIHVHELGEVAGQERDVLDVCVPSAC
jgi:hypothetical protein